MRHSRGLPTEICSSGISRSASVCSRARGKGPQRSVRSLARQLQPSIPRGRAIDRCAESHDREPFPSANGEEMTAAASRLRRPQLRLAQPQPLWRLWHRWVGVPLRSDKTGIYDRPPALTACDVPAPVRSLDQDSAAGPADSHISAVTITAEVRHQAQVAPMTNGSRNVK